MLACCQRETLDLWGCGNLINAANANTIDSPSRILQRVCVVTRYGSIKQESPNGGDFRPPGASRGWLRGWRGLAFGGGVAFKTPHIHTLQEMAEAVLDYSALAGLTERQQLQYLLSMTSSSAERAPLADRKANVDLQVTVSKPAKAVLTTVQVCADDHDLGGDSELSLALVDPLLPSDEERRALKGFKSIADELLPYMRRGSLYNQCA